MSDNNDITDGAVDDGYGLSRSSGESMDADSHSSSTDDMDRDHQQADAPGDSAQSTQSHKTTRRSEQSDSTSTRQGAGADPSSDDTILRPVDWSSHAQSVLDDASPRQIDHRPTVRLDNGYHYILGRSNVVDGLTNTGARVRPELKNNIETAINNANRAFDDEDVKKTDYFEAALTVALWNHDEVLAVLAELGYGVRE